MLTLALTLALAQTQTRPVLNDRCPVTGSDVRNRVIHHHIAVRGRDYYVYDRTAAIRLKNCPECYLGKDGTPLNASQGPCPR
jgi:hypothetical protein